MKRIAHRLGVWGWRFRHWWYDKRSAAYARIGGLVVALLIALGLMTRGAVLLTLTPPNAVAASAAPHEAIAPIVWALIVALVAAVAMVLLAPKPPKPPDQKTQAPTTEDGQAAVRYYGTNWCDPIAMLAWKVVGKDAIKTKGGKK